MKQSVIVTPVTVNEYNEPVPGTGVVVSARLEAHATLLKGADGRDVVSAAKLMVPVGTAIAPDYQVTADGQTYTVISGGFKRDVEGYSTHQEWLLGVG
jgi:hypothetical protein